VATAAVVPVPAELGEDDVLAFVVPAAGAKLDPRDLIRHCEGQLAYFAIPRYVEILDEFPLTETGKVRKNVLRELGLRETTWDREREGVRLQRM
jgi:crotonobetaine/carnitine-CoA ligase